ncbi:metal ABC transporter substrate-binding protein [Devosia rhodophyticola]|uniref:Metal ABC transporter substrate-binding protein n=1 Tax=Devosia rhodophyticola TaxID=3026423 RepID=A0ABY7YYZ1_9HYPH|nr:metal ABC transporter substrate-binding protein [Devosia rhodophyticola]WDR06605.1 metal ABC transporter substrate-binding protein [Devosia rhodophyticola]
MDGMMKRAVLALVLGLISGGNAVLAAPVQAVASFSILGDMVARVGGERVVVTTIVGPNADTHIYDPRPGDVVSLAKADVFFVNGLHFEGWLDRFVGSTGFAGPVVVASDGVAAREMDEDGTVVVDPHAWQDLANGVIYARNIAAGLCGVDAAGCPTYEGNAKAYAEEMLALDMKIRARFYAVPTARRQVITSHDAFGYFGAAYGIEFMAPEGVSTESEASAADVARLIEQVRASGAKSLFVENMSDQRLLEQIGRETGATIGGALYADALSEPDEGAGSYLEMFSHNVAQLLPAMAAQ